MVGVCMKTEELYHAWLKRGKKPKYIAKVPIGNNRYRYFYDKAEYAAFLAGKTKKSSPADFVSNLSGMKLSDLKNVPNLITNGRDHVASFFRKKATYYRNRRVLRKTKFVSRRILKTFNPNVAVRFFKNLITSEEIKGHKYIAKIMLRNGKYRYFYDQSEYDAYKSKYKYQKDEPEFMHKFKKLDHPETFEDAILSINRDYKKGGLYTVNCVLCTTTYEMRRRGYDVKAKPYSNEINQVILRNTKNPYDITANDEAYLSSIYKNPVIRTVTNSPTDNLSSQLSSTLSKEPNTRGNILVKWKSANGGHSMIYEVDSKGKVRILDSQVASTDTKGHGMYLDDSSINRLGSMTDNVRVLRTDNLEFTEQGVDMCVENRM